MDKNNQASGALTDAQIDDMAFGYAPSSKIGELREFARAIEAHLLAAPSAAPLTDEQAEHAQYQLWLRRQPNVLSPNAWAAWQARASLAPSAAGSVPPELREIGRLLATQDNRITDQPLFIVQQRRRIYGIDPDYTDSIVWLHAAGDHEEASAEEAAELEAEYQDTGRERNGWTRTGYVDEWEFVTACFTEQGCKDYLAKDGHNLKEPRIYADGSYRNTEYRAVRNWLLTLAAAPPLAQQAAPADRDATLDEAREACGKVGAKGWSDMKTVFACMDEIVALKGKA